jgi:hypothetical protein
MPSPVSGASLMARLEMCSVAIMRRRLGARDDTVRSGSPRPAGIRDAERTEPTAMVHGLRDLLGARLLAYIGDAS